MPHFTPDELAAWTGGHWTGRPSAAISGFTIDSRQARPGDCFVALRTDRRDGHDFVAAAARAGAVAAVVTRPIPAVDLPQLVVGDAVRALQDCARAHRRRFAGQLIAITGTAGKTSTKELLAGMLGPEQTLATVGNLNNFLGVPLTLLRIEPARHRYAVVEVGINQPGEMELLAPLVAPDAAIVTSVGAAHLEGLGSVEGVAAEKVRLLQEVPTDGWKAFPVGCLRFASFRDLPGARAVTAGAPEGGANVIFQAKHKRNTEAENEAVPSVETAGRRASGGILLKVELPDRPALFLDLPPLSAGMRMNVVLAAAVALMLGREPEEIAEAVRLWRPAQHRGEEREIGPQRFYIDCYNANPVSMTDAIRYFSERYPAGPRLFVIGSMRELGESSEAAHRAIGGLLRLGPDDRAIFIGEHANALRTGALEAGNPASRIEVSPDAVVAAPDVAAFRGTIFLKGSRAWRLESLVPAEAAASC